MTPSTRALFDAFTQLPDSEQLLFAMAVLRWTTDRDPDAALAEEDDAGEDLPSEAPRFHRDGSEA